MSSEKLRWPCFGVVLAGLFFGLSLSSWSHHRWFEITLFGVFVQVIPFTKCGLKKLVTDVESFARHLWHQVCCTWVGLRCIASSLSFQLARIRFFLSLLMCFFSFLRGFFELKLPNALCFVFYWSTKIIGLASAQWLATQLFNVSSMKAEDQYWTKIIMFPGDKKLLCSCGPLVRALAL